MRLPIILAVLLAAPGCGFQSTQVTSTSIVEHQAASSNPIESSMAGVWTVEAFLVDGYEMPSGHEFRFTFSGNRFTSQSADLPPKSGTFRMDRAQDPWHFDLTYDESEEENLGILAISNGKAQWAFRIGGMRPDNFDSEVKDKKIVYYLTRKL